jgi:hypothetical protein
MAIAFRSNTIGLDNNEDNSNVVGAPSGLADDDIMIFAVVRANNQLAITWPGTFAELFTQDYTGGSNLAVAWQRAASESGSYTASWGGSISRSCGIMYAISGCLTTANPITTGTAVSNGPVTSLDPPSADPGFSAARMAIAIYAQDGKGNGRFTQPSGYTEPTNSDGGTTGMGSAAQHCGLGMSYLLYTGQAEDPGTVTSSINDHYATNTLILDPVPISLAKSDRKRRFRSILNA